MRKIHDAPPPPPDPRDKEEAHIAYWLMATAGLFIALSVAAYWFWP